MLTVAEALASVLACSTPLPPARLPLGEALGRVLAEDVASDLDLPPFDKSLVDGYACRASDLAALQRPSLALGEEILAGRTPTRPLGPREAASIMTGAPLPEGADVVVMSEQSRQLGSSVHFADPTATAGRNVLLRGREMRAGEVVARRGDVLNPARLGVLASVGRAEALAIPRPHVAIIPTGDELVEPPAFPGPGQIRNSNGPLLAALVAAAEGVPMPRPIAPDEPEALAESLAAGLAADVLLISGGVSAGLRDLVPATLARLGVREVFHKVRLKPGKPVWFGVGPPRGEAPGALVFGLPGNPVGAVVGFLLFARAALDVLSGRDHDVRLLGVALASPFAHRGDRPTYHPGRRLADGRVEPLAWAGSSDLRAVGSADGFLAFPAGDRDHEAGEVVAFLDARWSRP